MKIPEFDEIIEKMERMLTIAKYFQNHFDEMEMDDVVAVLIFTDFYIQKTYPIYERYAKQNIGYFKFEED